MKAFSGSHTTFFLCMPDKMLKVVFGGYNKKEWDFFLLFFLFFTAESGRR